MKVHMLALVCVLALAVVACGEQDTAAPADDPGTPADGTEADEPVAGDTEADDTEADDTEAAIVAVAPTEHGDVLVDADGLTLYLFDNDQGGASTCYDDCASTWPPLLADGGIEAGDGADAGLVGTVERDDGSLQATYAGHPLYSFAGDSAPGDVEGQGIGDVWWVVTAGGEPVTGDEQQAEAGGRSGYDSGY